MQANETDIDLAANDLGPLAWVLDELRKSLDSASAALRRFVRDANLARGSDMASVDTGQLRIARQQVHQAVGALEMVGLGSPAHVLRAMEGAVQKFVERPELCSEAAAAKVERAGFALTEYLEALLLGKPVSAVALFPQYRDVQEVAGADRVHPADLWAMDWRWSDPDVPLGTAGAVYEPAVRSKLDQSVLKVVKSGDADAAQELGRLSLALAATQSARQPRIFWKLCAAYFEAARLGLLPADLYAKRVASRVLLQYASLAKGDLGVSERLAQDMLFFCSQAVPQPGTAPALEAVRQTWGLARFKPVDYQNPQFGRFDPMLLAQGRKRIGVAKETWSGLSGGDANKLKAVADQFHLVSDSLLKLHPASAPLAKALTSAIEAVVRMAQAPRAELAMEVATAVLYLEAAFEDLDPSDPDLAARTGRLAVRLDNVRAGGMPEPLEPWMEELYRRVSDRQTMGSVVGELRTTLSELEKLLDQFFRNPADKTALRDAPGHLSQMRGVLSVLGLDQASQAVLRMREAVEEIIVTEVDEQQARAAGTFDKLGNNLGALGFLIDMLNYQPALAKKLFVYDAEHGELKPLMGRSQPAKDAHAQEPSTGELLSREVQAVVASDLGPQDRADLTVRLDQIAAHAVLADQPAVAHSAREAAAAMSSQDADAASAALSSLAAAVQPAAAAPAAPPASDDIEEDDLQDIFLEEAREVVTNGLAAVAALRAAPGDVSELTTLRRAFHTLKGSSRMVGLTEFGEAAWSMEQVLNTWLADQKPASDDLRALAGDAMRGFGRWVEDIAAKQDQGWKAAAFRTAAEALRSSNELIAIALPPAAPAAEQAPAAEPAAPPAHALIAFDLPDLELPQAEPAPAPAPEAAVPAQPATEALAEPAVDLLALDLDVPSLPAVEPAAPEAVEPVAAAQAAPTEAAPDPFAGLDIETIEAAALPQEPAVDEAAAAFELTQVIRAAPPEAAELPASEVAADFDFDFGTPAPALPAEPPPQIDGIDFASLAALSLQAEPDAPEAEAAPVAEDTAQAQAAEAAAMPVDDTAAEVAAEAAIDEQVKVIGSLRIGIPLYNVYLNEADEWSRRLVTEVSEWALELNQPLPDSTVGLAHALAGSSATVGFHALSDIARALEGALQQTQSLAYGTPQHGRAFTEAADEIRRLLHQFAAGFLKEPDPDVAHALAALRDLDVPKRAETGEDWQLDARDGADDWDGGTAAAPSQATYTEPASAAPSTIEMAPQAAAPEPEPETPVELQPAAHAPASLPQPPMAAVPPQAPERATVHVEARDDDGDDEIDVADALDVDLFPIFEEEAIELLPQLGGALRQWSARPDNRSARAEVLRALHTLKGSARLAGALRMGEMAHRMESEIEQVASDDTSAASVEPLLQRFDNLQAAFDALRHGQGVLQSAPEAPAAVQAPAMPAAAAQAPANEPGPAPVSAGAGAPLVAAAPARALLAMPVTSTLVPQRSTGNQAVRVRSQLLDRLVNQAGEVMITRSRLESELRQLRGSLDDLTGNLDRLRSQLRDIELQAESQMQSRLAQAKDSAAGFDPLEFDRFTRVQELTRMMAESVNDVATVQRNLQRTVESTEDDLIAQARQTRELQRDLLRTRMMEFEGISDRLYRVVRLASKETGKQVKLDITGGSIEMDRGVLDRMTPAFEHLLRNCVAHGIEDPDTRRRMGKDAAGTILIELHHEGNDVSVSFQDDGAGLDLARIREKGLQQGLLRPEQELSDAELANLIFMPGFSTATQVTELAGRGIGMDVVRSEVNALGGRIETTTRTGKGTSFKLVLPLTTAVTQVVMIRSGKLAIGVPANLVEIVRRAPAKDVQQAYNSGSYEFGGEQLPFFWSGALLQASQRSTEPQARTLPVVVFRSAAQRIAVHVDEVLGNQEVVVKNLGPQLSRLPGLAGMTVLASGAVVLIYNPVALTAVYGEQARALSADHAQPEMLGEVSEPGKPSVPAMPAVPAAPQVPLVLVVDDSITVRRVTQRLLQREGYRVTMAADGLQALEKLAEEKPSVVLSDIEMPRMDGFDLARNIRADARLADLPIIMITSRIAEKHREHAKELGVNHYLGKPYSEEELLSLTKHYCATAAAAV